MINKSKEFLEILKNAENVINLSKDKDVQEYTKKTENTSDSNDLYSLLQENAIKSKIEKQSKRNIKR